MLAIVDFQSQLFLMNVAVLDLITRQLLAFQVTTTHKGNFHYDTIVGSFVGYSACFDFSLLEC